MVSIILFILIDNYLILSYDSMIYHAIDKLKFIFDFKVGEIKSYSISIYFNIICFYFYLKYIPLHKYRLL
ncbi:hypothetical protein SAMN05216480_104198 [Pustulibacterium marinum]|uniref:Uncharacterized protein n=1 Tax=Pustulibacterium marinum TaxID=1224947 RepID=A0A1I7GG90_9FLAO|nr:hypothetical protein SAMN05216480_104198 [Pustulibacterium marinum]